MYKIDQNNIFLVKGDTLVLRIETMDEEGYGPELENATGTLTLKEHINTTEIILQKTLFNHIDEDRSCGVIYFRLESADTKDLSYDKYFYDIQITVPRTDGLPDDVFTLRRGDFYITHEIS